MSAAAYPQIGIVGPVNQTAGVPFSAIVSILNDEFGHVDSSYRGTVHFSSSDPLAVLPNDYTFVGGDVGEHLFAGIVLQTPGRQIINIVDINDSEVLGVVSISILQTPASVVIYKEETAEWSPEQISANLKDGKASWAYRVLGISDGNDILDSLVAIFGTTDLGINGGPLQRTLPYSHPLLPFWYARNISSIKGVGGGGVQPQISEDTTDLPITQEVPAIPSTTDGKSYWGLYPEYQYIIDFGPFPYAVVSDGVVQSNVSIGAAYDDVGTIYSFGYAPEWIRYTNWIPDPRFESISYQYGVMKFRVNGNPSPNANNQPFGGFPKVFLPNQLIKFYWYQVPMRYIISAYSYLNRFVGRINQNNWYNWSQGTLLYLGYKPGVYTPPVPKAQPVYQRDAADNLIATNAFSTEKLVDLEMSFLWTTRTSLDAPNSNSLINKNFIALGHNLLPWFSDRKFHYASTDDGNLPYTATQFPSWLSVPFELLFTDPDTTLVNGKLQPYYSQIPLVLP